MHYDTIGVAFEIPIDDVMRHVDIDTLECHRRYYEVEA